MCDNALIPPRIAKQRTVGATSWFSLFMFGGFIANTYFIPIYFQAVTGASAEASGIRMIPLVAVNVATLIAVGMLVAKTGYYVPFFIACSAVSSVGCGLITTWQVDSSAGAWAGYQIVSGVGSGLAMQLPAVAVQAVRVSRLLLLRFGPSSHDFVPPGAPGAGRVYGYRDGSDIPVPGSCRLCQRFQQRSQLEPGPLHWTAEHPGTGCCRVGPERCHIDSLLCIRRVPAGCACSVHEGSEMVFPHVAHLFLRVNHWLPRYGVEENRGQCQGRRDDTQWFL